MRKNIGIYDSLIRIIATIIIAILYFINVINGTLALILIILGVYLVLTGLLGWSPLYDLLSIRSCPMKEKPNN